jgi:hypothetical protein
MNQEQIIDTLVDWALERTEVLPDEDDELSLLQEFDEWICYKNGETVDVEVFCMECKI